MAKAELTKTIEAIKLNKRTMRPMTTDSHTIPYGAIVEQLKEDGEHMQFLYLGEPYQSKAETVLHAIRRLD